MNSYKNYREKETCSWNSAVLQSEKDAEVSQSYLTLLQIE